MLIISLFKGLILEPLCLSVCLSVHVRSGPKMEDVHCYSIPEGQLIHLPCLCVKFGCTDSRCSRVSFVEIQYFIDIHIWYKI